MKFTVDRIENGIAVCEASEEENIIKKEFPTANIPFEIKEGTIFSVIEKDGISEFVLSESDVQDTVETKKRVRSKLNKLFNRKK